jgi:hypothetical protein
MTVLLWLQKASLGTTSPDEHTKQHKRWPDNRSWAPRNSSVDILLRDTHWMHNQPADNLPEDNLPEDNLPEDNLPEDNQPEDRRSRWGLLRQRKSVAACLEPDKASSQGRLQAESAYLLLRKQQDTREPWFGIQSERSVRLPFALLCTEPP